MHVVVIRIGVVQDLSRRAGIEGASLHPRGKTSPAQRELREDVAVGVHARTTYPAELELRIDGMWGISRDAGIEGRFRPRDARGGSQDLSRPAGEYPEILELRIDGMWGISRVRELRVTRAVLVFPEYPARRELRVERLAGPDVGPIGVARPIPLSGN